MADSISCWPHNPWDSVSEVNVEPLTHVAGKNTADISFCSLSLSASPGASYLLLTVVLLGAQEYSVSAKSHRCPEALRVTKHGCCSSAARLPTPHPSCTQPTGDTRPQPVWAPSLGLTLHLLTNKWAASFPWLCSESHHLGNTRRVLRACSRLPHLGRCCRLPPCL